MTVGCSVIFSTLGGFPSPWVKISDSSYVQNFDIFHLRPVPSKNIENLTEEIKLWKFGTNFSPTGIPENRKR